jgi:hypothetical protein
MPDIKLGVLSDMPDIRKSLFEIIQAAGMIDLCIFLFVLVVLQTILNNTLFLIRD